MKALWLMAAGGRGGFTHGQGLPVALPLFQLADIDETWAFSASGSAANGAMQAVKRATCGLLPISGYRW